MSVLPPGTLLQLMYLKKRLRHIDPGYFIEIGPGNGEVTKVLLDYGWSGCSYDLDANTVTTMSKRFSKEISDKRFMVINEDYLLSTPPTAKKADLIISSMVIEHLDDEAQLIFMQKSKINLEPNGIMIGIVPGSPAHWGIEDDIAGHCRRYTQSLVQEIAADNGWRTQHLAGLTFPISNFLLPISNFLVNKSEQSKLALSHVERTKLSGRRQVKFKTHFPSILRILLNEFTLFPLYLIQNLFLKSKRALVIYFELQLIHNGIENGK